MTAGLDQTVCASSPNVQLAGAFGGAAAGATWSGGAGTFNPNAATPTAIYTPSPAEIAAGMVILTLTTNDPSGPCGAVSDQMVITILPFATVNAGADFSTCASSPTVSLGGSVGGSATGGVWSGGTGTFNPSANALNAMYTLSPAEIVAGTVTLTLTTTGTCAPVSDQITITVTASASASAGPDQTVCSTSPTVTLAGSIGGAPGGMWSGGAGTFNPNNTTLNAMYTPTAGEIAAGQVTLTLTTAGGTCGIASDTMTIFINQAATVDAGGGTFVCASNPSVQLAGSFGGGATSATWSGGTGTFNPNANTPNAIYTPSAAEIAAGDVTLTLTTDDPAGPCGAVSAMVTFSIEQAPTVSAGPDQTVCATNPSVQLAGAFSGPGPTGAMWSGGAGTFNPNANTLNAIYTPSAAEITAGTVTLTLTTIQDSDSSCGPVVDMMTITINPAATVNAGPDQTVCATSPNVQLAGSVGGGAATGNWSGGSGSFNPNASTLNAVYTPSAGEIAAGMVTLTLTTNDPIGPCGSVSDTITITINAAATVNAGADIIVCATSPAAQLNGSFGGAATGITWSGGAGTFNPNANTPNATYTPTADEIAAGMVTLTLTTNDPSGPCGAVSDQVLITINPAATVNAGAPITVCATSPAAQLNGSVGGSATGGAWSGGAGAFTPNANTLNAIYTPSPAEIAAGTVTLTLTTNDPAGPCGSVSATVVITINPAATVNAGADVTVCATNPAAQLNGVVGDLKNVRRNVALGVTWSGGTGTFSPNANVLNPIYTPSPAEIAAGSVTLTLTTDDPAGPCGPVSDQVVIFINPAPTVNAGPDLTVCATSPTVTLGGSFGGAATGATWSGGTGTFTPNVNTPNATYTPSAAETTAGTVTLTLTTNDPAGPCGPVSDTVVITINPTPVVNAGDDITVCATNPVAQLSGAIGGAAISATWTTSGTGTFAPNANTLNATYTPSAADIAAGMVTLTLTTNDPAGPCGAVSDTVIIAINPAATLNAGPDQVVCATSSNVQLAATVGGGAASATWSGGTGTFNPNATTLNAVYTPSAAETAAGTVTLTLTTNDPAGPCGPITDTIVITINPAATVNAGGPVTVCATSPTVSLGGSFGGAAISATWTGGTGTFNPNANTPNATYTPSAAEIAAGTVTLTLTTNDPAGPCGAVSAQKVITINPAATVNAGADQTVCATSPAVTLTGIIGGAATGATWSGGAGTFNPNATTLNAVYTPSAAEIAAGTVTLTLTTNDPAGLCGPVTDTIVITINPAATVNAGPDLTVCSTSATIQLAGVIGGAATSATWTGGTGTFSPTATTLNATYTPSAAEIAAGTVTLTLTTNDPAGACGAVSDTVAFTINAAATVNAGVDINVPGCATTVQLAGTIGGGATGATWTTGGSGTFSPNATTLNASYIPSQADIAAEMVTLTLTTNDPAGPCGPVSDQIVLRFNICQADLSLTKVVDNGAPCVGANVTFTITVRNSGPGATNDVMVRDLLPQGLSFVSAQPGQGTYNSNTGIWNIGPLNVNQTVTLTITATVGPIGIGATNTAEIISSSLSDPDSTPNNNNPNEDDQASVTINTTKGPGEPFPALAEGSDQKAGAVLVYNFYSSSATTPNTQNTRISLTNVNPNETISVHLFFVDGTSCSVADSYLCLTPNQTSTFQMSDLDPGTTGYIVAVVVDCETGCPSAANCLIGDAYIKLETGHAANLNAEAFSALQLNPAGCDINSVTAELKFDGVRYNRLPRVLSADNLPSRADGNDTLLVVNRIGGNLGIGTSTLGSLFGLLYNDTESVYSFTFSGACQFRSPLSNSFPRTTPRYETAIPAGRSGWMRLSAANDTGGLLGAMINFNPNSTATANAFNQGHNLHHLTLTTSGSLIVPVFAPNCCAGGKTCLPQ